MSNDLLKELRELTGAGMLEIKQALDEAKGDKEKTIDLLRKKGALKLAKKAERLAKEGVVEAYIHPGSRMGVLLELNCETDFVAKTDDFKALARDIAMHIAAASPAFVSTNDIPAETLEKEKEIYRESDSAKASANKPEILEKIIQGKLQKYYEDVCLLEQAYIKNPDIKVKDLISEAVGKMGENIQIKKFARFVLGN